MPKLPQIVFVCAPYSAPTHAAVTRNIKFAANQALKLAEHGFGFVCPHTNSRHFDDKITVDVEFWYEMYLAILESCDAMLVCGTWQKSVGCQGEIAYAEKHSIPVFYDFKSLLAWRGKR